MNYQKKQDLIARIAAHQEQAAQLSKMLGASIFLRSLYRLPDEGIVTTEIYKPSGVMPGKFKLYRVRVLHNGNVVVVDTLPAFKEATKGVIDTARLLKDAA